MLRPALRTIVPTLVMALLLGLLVGIPAASGANAANCDPELTQAQREQKTFCETHAACLAIGRLWSGCVSIKQWLNTLLGGGRPHDVTEDELRKKLPQLENSEAVELTDGPRADHCLPSEFDVALCRQYLGVDPIPIKVPTVVPKPSVDTQLRARMLDLYKEQLAAADAQGVAPGAHRSARNGLELCAAMRQRTDRADGCGTAQRHVAECRVFVADWRQRKAALLADIDRLYPGVGNAYSEPTPILRGVGKQPSNDQRWNDAVRGLRTLDIAECPGFVPNTCMTPEQALAQWDLEDRGAPANNCPAGWRNVLDVSPEDERKAAEATRRAQLRASLPRRDGGDGTALLANSAVQVEQDKLDPEGKARRERERLADQQRALQALRDASIAYTTDTLNMATSMYQQGLARAQAAPQQAGQQAQGSGAQPGKCIGDPQLCYEIEHDLPPGACLNGGCPVGKQQTYAAAPASSPQGPQQPQQQQVATSPPQAAGVGLYPSLPCASLAQEQNGTATRTVVTNRCTQSIEAYWSGGHWSLGPGASYPVSSGSTVYGACNVNDTLDRASGQCHR